jgi:molybdate transport system substrate-binding protein
MPNRNLTAALLAASLLAFVADSPQPATAQNELRVLCSNGFGAAMRKLLPQAERAAGRKVNVQFGTSATFRTSIEGGAPFDLAILTPQIIEDLTKAGKIEAGTKVDLATSGIGVAVRAGQPKPDIATADAMKKTLQAAKSVGYVPVGASTPPLIAMLTSLGIKQEVQRKAALQPGAEQSMKSVADGEVEIAVGLISEIVPAAGVQLAGPLPPEFQKRIGLAAGISGSTKNREAANKFIKSLTSAAAGPAIKATGLDPIAKEK